MNNDWWYIRGQWVQAQILHLSTATVLVQTSTGCSYRFVIKKILVVLVEYPLSACLSLLYMKAK